MSEEIGNRLFGDDPVDGSVRAPDRLGRKEYARQVSDLFERVSQQSDSGVLALIGPWGSGKSSALAMIAPNLEDYSVIEFNPWTYSDLESLMYGFFASLRSALPKGDRWSETRKALGEFAAMVSPLGKLTALVGFDASDIAAAGAKVLMGDTSVAAIKHKAEEALREAGKRIIVIMDDLDRLGPDELLLVFKLVRLVGRLPNVYYLLAYDERTLLDTLRRTELIGGDESRARDYLEKIVQVRLDLPVLRENQSGALVDAALEAVLVQNKIELGPDDTQRLSLAYYEHMRHRLSTPRVINRFFAQVDAFYASLGSEVSFSDFVLVTFLRTMEPGVYRMVQRYRSELTGTDCLGLAAQKLSNVERLNRWRERLVAADVIEENVEGVLSLLALLFVPVRSAVDNSFHSHFHIEDISRRRGVGHVDYFDRFFAFGVPGEDIADSVVAEAMQLLKSGEHGLALTQLAAGIRNDTDRVVRKLRRRMEAGEVPEVELLAFLASQYGSLSEIKRSLLSDSRRSAAFLVRELLSHTPSDMGIVALRRMSETDGGLLLAATAVARLKRDNDSEAGQQFVTEWLGEACTTISDLIASRLTSASDIPLTGVPDDIFELIWPWMTLDLPALQMWLKRYVFEKTGAWSLIDILARMVSDGIGAGVDGIGKPVLGDISLGTVDELFGLNDVLQVLSEDIDQAEPPEENWGIEPTPENRKRHVLGMLRRARDQDISSPRDI